ncbi:hypothetical protein [Pseudomonas synxantha]|uniref:hypothetical protein n=1 Tax=Pseudomonas synxantha TaxID=47883 RepID=UPI0013DE75E3|nr:hypothetical protein [Pseudomonas synxantha]
MPEKLTPGLWPGVFVCGTEFFARAEFERNSEKSPAVTGEFWQNAISQAFCVPKFL